MTPAAPHDEDSRATRSRSHTRTSVQQRSLPTVMQSARTVSQVTSKCCTRTSTVERRACTSRVCVCQRASACDHSQSAVQTQSTLLKNGLNQTPVRKCLCTNPCYRTCCEHGWMRGQNFLKGASRRSACCSLSNGHTRVRCAPQPHLRQHLSKRSSPCSPRRQDH